MYWVLGASDFLRTNLISCIGRAQCGDLQFVEVNAPIITEGLDKRLLVSSRRKKRTQHLSSSEKHISFSTATTATTSTELQTGVVPSDHHLYRTIRKQNEKNFRPVCLYTFTNSVTALCQVCLMKMSDLASMERYYIYQESSTVLYIIHSSNWEPSICGREGVCEDITAVLSHELCELIKTRVSSTQPHLDVLDRAPLPVIPETIKGKYNFWPTWYCSGLDKMEELRVGLKSLLLAPSCLITARAINRRKKKICWTCLAKSSNGLIVLDKMESTSGHGIRKMFLIRIHGRELDHDSKVRCSEECGDMIQSDQCMSDSDHVNDFLPPNDITQWIEREPHASQKDSMLDFLSGCMLLRHVSGQASNCRQCFLDRLTMKVSSVTFLVSPSTKEERSDAPICHPACIRMELMPDIICAFDQTRLRSKKI